MSEQPKAEAGKVAWVDLTVTDAVEIRDFYSRLVGWKPQPVEMGGYQDFNMTRPSDGQTVAGICHAKGNNSALPTQWLVYFTVSDLDESMRQCVELGGKVIDPARDMGDAGRMCVIEDPAGAVCALFEAVAPLS